VGAMRALAPLVRGSDEAVGELLIERLADPAGEVRVLAIGILGRLQVRRAAPRLIALASRGGDVGSRTAAIEALGRLAQPSATLPLLAIVTGGPEGLRRPAAEALIQLEDPAAISPLVDHLARATAGEADPAAVRALAGLVRNRRHREGRRTLERLAQRAPLRVSLTAIAGLSASADPASRPV